MNKYQKAAMLFGKAGSAGESDAIANYLEFVGTIEDQADKFRTPEDVNAAKNVLERIGDELNHLLGDTLDAINMAGLKIAKDDMDKILEGLRAAVDTDETQVSVNITSPTSGTINL